MSISAEDRSAYLAAEAEVSRIEKVRAGLVAHTEDEYHAAQSRLMLVAARTGEPITHCEACGEPVFEGEPVLWGETPLCGRNGCAPTYESLLTPPELFVDAEGDPLTPEAAAEAYGRAIAAGHKPDDSMASVS